MYPSGVIVSFNTLPTGVCCISLSCILTTALVFLPIFISINLPLLVLIFHLCSKLSPASMFLAVNAECRALDLVLHGIICVMLSAYAM